MRLILNMTLAVEALVTLLWTVAWWTETGSSGIAVLGWLAIVIVVFAVCFLVGAVAAWWQPPLRRRAVLIMAVALIGGFLPSFLRMVTAGPVSMDFVWRLGAFALAVLFVVAMTRPRATAHRLPGLLFRSRALNIAIVSVLALAWCVLLLTCAWLLSEAGQDAVRRADRTSNGMAAAYVVLGISAYLLMIGAGSIVSAAWGWLGLMGGIEGARRRIHLTQLAGAMPGILIAAATWAWLLTQR